MSERNWLRPRWYETHWGGLVMSGPHPHQFTSEDDPDPTCSVCGVDCPDGGFDFRGMDRADSPNAYMCREHGDEWHAAHPLTGWQKRMQNVSIRLDNLYFWYCEHFGKRIVESPPEE